MQCVHTGKTDKDLLPKNSPIPKNESAEKVTGHLISGIIRLSDKETHLTGYQKRRRIKIWEINKKLLPVKDLHKCSVK